MSVEQLFYQGNFCINLHTNLRLRFKTSENLEGAWQTIIFNL